MPIVYSRDGTAVAYEVIGRGRPVIMVDGALSYRNFGMMKPLAVQMTSAFSAIVYDRRGRGESGGTSPCAVEREIEDIEALADHAGERAFAYGISSGAVLALRAAAALKNKINMLALYEPPFPLGKEHLRAAAEYSRRLKELLDGGKNGEAVSLFMAHTGSPPQIIDSLRGSPQWPYLEALAPTLAYDDAVMGDGRIPAAAAAVDMPVLVLAGGASPAYMREAAEALAKDIPGAVFRVLPGQTHTPAQSALALVLMEFFNAR